MVSRAGSPGTGATARVRLVVFPGGVNWPIWVAQAKGWFEENGLALEVAPTPGSVFQLTNLVQGKFDLAITLLDNVIAYREGQGEAPVTGPDLVAVMAADTRMFPTLITLPEIRTYSDLKGKTLCVDAMTTGYAFVLIEMLKRGGLSLQDYKLESLGGALERFNAMRERRSAGALFNSPFEGLLRAEGYTVLDTAIGTLGAYEGMVLAGRHAWMKAHRVAVTGFIRAFRRAVTWLYAPENRDEAAAIFHAAVPAAAPGAAEVAYAVLFDPRFGFVRDGRLDGPGVRQVIALREAHAKPAKKLGEPGRYYDPRFLDAAAR